MNAKRYSQTYNSSYNPAIPVLTIIAFSDAGTEVAVTALVDSGADLTMLPRSALQQVGAQYSESVFIRGVTGKREEVELFTVSIRLGPFELYDLDVAAVNRNADALLGRDVLNQFIVTLNGLADTTDVTDTL